MKKVTISLFAIGILLSGCATERLNKIADDPMTIESNAESKESIETMIEEIEPELEEKADIDEISNDSNAAFPGVEDNWPENIIINNDGLYADPLIVPINIDEPMTLSLSCITERGELSLKILDEDEKNIYFDEALTNGKYTVDIDDKGTYHVFLYAEYHVGRVEITPLTE